MCVGGLLHKVRLIEWGLLTVMTFSDPAGLVFLLACLINKQKTVIEVRPLMIFVTGNNPRQRNIDTGKASYKEKKSEITTHIQWCLQ